MWFLSPHTPLRSVMHLPHPFAPALYPSLPCPGPDPKEVGLLPTAKAQDGFRQRGPELKTTELPAAHCE